MDDLVNWVPRGFLTKGHKVRSCGKAHPWCGVCRPDQAAKQRTRVAKANVGGFPCRKCGSCDVCIGLIAPPGFKVCRKCQQTKAVSEFPTRGTGKIRNSCRACARVVGRSTSCQDCGRLFLITEHSATKCRKCRPLPYRSCAACGGRYLVDLNRRRYCSPACRDASTQKKRARAHENIRLAALAAYGGPTPSCACCGEGILRFLAIDHIDGGGGKHRRETGGGGFWTWLKRNGFPPGFRILCHNCNFGRQLNGGICPHDALVRDLVGV